MLPSNPQLWYSLVDQAKAKYPSKNPMSGRTTFPENKMVKDKYLQAGGQFVDSADEMTPQARQFMAKINLKKKKEAQQRAIMRRRARGEAV